MARRKKLDFGDVATPVRIGSTAQQILQKTVDDGVADLDMAKEIRLDLIDPDPDQPRKHFDPEALEELARSIRVQGVLQPIIVEWVAESGRFRIISGERRWRATRMAAEMQAAETEPPAPRRDLTRIPAIIKNPSAIDRYVQQVYENEQRRDYSDVERAFAYERLKEALQLTWDDLAAKLGLSKGRIHQIRRTKNRLAPSVQDDITSGKLTGRHGLYLAPLPEPVQELVAKAVKDNNLTHQQTKTLVGRVRGLMERDPEAVARYIARKDAETQAKGATETAAPAPVGEAASGENLTERKAILETPAPAGEGVTSYTSNVAAALAEEVAAVTAPKPRIPRARREDLDKTLALVRQLVRQDLQLPETDADRAKLSLALDELIAWAQGLKAQLGAVADGESR